MHRRLLILMLAAALRQTGYAQSPAITTFMNPVIPGDHPDCTLTKVGNDFYTTGSSFNPTPVIYHSTDLVHWEAVAQPVSASWAGYGDTPAGGCWGGQVVYYNHKYWDFFSRSNVMYFTTADDVRGTWSTPTMMSTPTGVPGLGYDNSIFIDDDGSWYLLVKNGQVNNWIVQLGNDGQPGGKILNLTWINPAPSYPFSWAEGPVMWKFRGNYYYSFARNVAGGQIVFRSSSLTDDQNSWVNLGNFFNEGDPLKSQALFQSPNHASAAVMLDDSTSWVVHPLWRNANNNEWYGQGRQGLLNQVRYDSNGKPTADYPVNAPLQVPALPSSGIPWMVPHSDFFTSDRLNPEWSLLGYTPASSYSLTTRAGWLTLSPKRKANTIIKNDGEHNYAIITRLDFSPLSVSDQAGIWIFNGLQTLYTKLYSSVDSAGGGIVAFSYQNAYYEVKNPPVSGDNTMLLKLVRVNHSLSGFCSSNGIDWIKVGEDISVADMENLQANYNSWTGNRQGLFVQGIYTADFDFYLYRDAYTPILAECPANQYGTYPSGRPSPVRSLDGIHGGDWALYAGVEFGNNEYSRMPDSLVLTASSGSLGGVVEVWLDSLSASAKIAQCSVPSTGSWDVFTTVSTPLLRSVSGNHDVYVTFKGSGTDRLLMLQWIQFTAKPRPATSVIRVQSASLPERFSLEQNFPNPFNPSTTIEVKVAQRSLVSVRVLDILGREITTLLNDVRDPGTYRLKWDAPGLPSGVYFCQMRSGGFEETKRMVLEK